MTNPDELAARAVDRLREQLGGLADQLDESRVDLHTSLNELQAAEQHVRSAKDAARGAQEAVRRVLASIAALGLDPPTLRPLARLLYWQQPEIHAASIGLLLGCSANLVCERVGPLILERHCGRCGVLCPVACRSRQHLDSPDRESRSWRCAACRAAEEQERAQSQARWRVEDAQRADQWRRRRQAFAAGNYQVIGQIAAGRIITFAAEDGGGEWLIPEGGTLDDAGVLVVDR